MFYSQCPVDVASWLLLSEFLTKLYLAGGIPAVLIGTVVTVITAVLFLVNLL